MSNSSITYPDPTEGQTDFAITFPYLRVSDINIYVNGVEVSWSLASESIARLAVGVTAGDDVLIQRITARDTPYATFDQVINTTNLNNTITQLLYTVQEQDFVLANLGLDSLDPDYVPPATATDQMIISQSDGVGGFEWITGTLSSILPSGAAGYAPDPSAVLDDRFLLTESGALVYKTPAEVAALVNTSGISLPDPTGSGGRWVVSTTLGDGYELLSAAEVRTGLSLGTAALRNAGTAVGQCLLIADAGGGAPALPAIAAGGLTGVAIVPESAQITRVAANNSTDRFTTDVMTDATWDGTDPDWAQVFTDGGDVVGVTLQEAGTYILDFSASYFRWTGAIESAVPTLVLTGGTVDTLRGVPAPTTTSTNSFSFRIQVTVLANTNVRPQLIGIGGSAQVQLTDNTGAGSPPSAVLSITKVE